MYISIGMNGGNVMSNSDLIFSKIDHFNENLISNIQGGVIICQFDPTTNTSKTVYLSDGWTELTGYTLPELNDEFGGNPQALVYFEDSARCNRDYMEQTSHGNSYQLEYRCRHKDGRLLWVIDRGIITSTADGHNQNQSILTNITPMKQNEEKLRMSEARFRIATRASHAAVFEFDIAEKRYLYLENAAVIFRADAQTVISSFDAARAHAQNFNLEDVFRQWYHPEDVPALLHSYEEILHGGIGECDVRLRLPNGSYIWCKLHQVTVEDDNGQPLRVVGHLLDIEEQHRQTERLLLEAQSDALTGLYNKTAIRDLAAQALKSAPQLTQALFMLDIDNFKGVNDQLGHLFGDAVLMDVSAKLKQLFRRDGMVGRIGGDEFAVLLQADCSVQSAANRAKSICSAFRHTYSGEKKDYKISCSVGIALSTAGDSFDTLFHKADLALYRAKSLGKDQYSIYTTDMNNTISPEAVRINQNDNADSGKLRIKERIFELLYDSVDFSGSINMILALLGQRLEASHLYIYENTSDNQFAELIYEWHAEGIPYEIEKEQRLPVDKLNYYSNFNEYGIFCCQDFSAIHESLRFLFEKCSIRSTFQVAILQENIIKGFVRYDSSHDVNLSSEKIEIMTFAAKITGTFIIKKRADEGVKLYNENKMEALDSLPSAIYIIDEQYRLHYVNNMVQSTYPDIVLKQKCHEVFMHNDSPCPNCPAAGNLSVPCSTEVYNPYSKIWMIASASRIRWSGCDNMRLICCQIINQYKDQPALGI